MMIMELLQIRLLDTCTLLDNCFLWLTSFAGTAPRKLLDCAQLHERLLSVFPTFYENHCSCLCLSGWLVFRVLVLCLVFSLPRLFPVFVDLYVCVVFVKLLPSCIIYIYIHYILYLWSGAVVHFYACLRLCIVLYLLYFCVIFVKHLPSSRQGVVFVVASPFTRKRLQAAKRCLKLTFLIWFLTKEKKRIRPL